MLPPARDAKLIDWLDVRCAVPRFGEGAVNEELGCGEIFAADET